MAAKRHRSEAGHGSPRSEVAASGERGAVSGEARLEGDGLMGGIKKLRINSPLYGMEPADSFALDPSTQTREEEQIRLYAPYNSLLGRLHNERRLRARDAPSRRELEPGSFQGGVGTPSQGRLAAAAAARAAREGQGQRRSAEDDMRQGRPPLYPAHGAQYAHQAQVMANHEADLRLAHGRLVIEGDGSSDGSWRAQQQQQQLQQLLLQQQQQQQQHHHHYQQQQQQLLLQQQEQQHAREQQLWQLQLSAQQLQQSAHHQQQLQSMDHDDDL